MAAAIVEMPQTTVYERVPCDLPGVGIWVPTIKDDASTGKVEELEAVETSTSFLKRVVSASRNAIPSMSRSSSTKVSPTLSSKKNAKSSGVQLTALEKQYLDYLRKSVGTGEFSHYLLPAP